jgi:MFS family permease
MTAISAPATSDSRDSRRWLILAVLGIAQLMVVLDITIVNIALPSAQKALGFSNSDRQWIITAYALAFGSLLLLGGRIGDLVGRKRTFIVGLTGFAVASAVGGMAQSFLMLVAARATQGAFAALLAPAALSLLTTTFTDLRERGKAFGIYSAIAGGGGAVGLLLGGVLTQDLSWRWCLYVNLGFAIIAGIGGMLLLERRPAGATPKLDLPGTLTAVGGLVALVYGLNNAETSGWGASLTLACLAGGVSLLTGFVLIQRRSTHPLLPLRVVLDRNHGGASLTIAVIGAGMFGLFLFLTYYLQETLGFSPIGRPAGPARPRPRPRYGDVDRYEHRHPGRALRRRQRRLGQRQHDAADRRLDRHRAAEHGRRERDEQLHGIAPLHRAGRRPRIHDGVWVVGGDRRRRSDRLRAADTARHATGQAERRAGARLALTSCRSLCPLTDGWVRGDGLRPERDPQNRPTVWRVARYRKAPVCVGRLFDDRQSQPRAGQPSRLVSTIEPVEHARDVFLLEARPMVTHIEHSIAQDDFDPPAGRAPLARVVDQVGDGTTHAFWRVDDLRRLELEAERELRSAAVGAGYCLLYDVVELDWLGVLARRGSTGEVHDIGDELCQLVELGDNRVL